MRILLLSILALLTLASCSKQEPMEALIDRVFTLAEQQYTDMDTRLTEKTLPRTLSADGEFVPSGIYWWCSGFYPGSLWYIYEYTGNDAVKTLAEKNTLKLDSIQYVTRDHDVGFQLNCSYGNAFRLTGNEAYNKCSIKAPNLCLPASIPQQALFVAGTLCTKAATGSFR